LNDEAGMFLYSIIEVFKKHDTFISMCSSYAVVIASKAKQSSSALRPRLDCFGYASQ